MDKFNSNDFDKFCDELLAALDKGSGSSDSDVTDVLMSALKRVSPEMAEMTKISKEVYELCKPLKTENDFVPLMCTCIDMWCDDHKEDVIKIAAHILTLIFQKQNRK